MQDAAAGRTAVTLYVCTTDPRMSTARIVASLTCYAAARDWQVIKVLLDESPLDQPLREREGWTGVCSAITDGRAEGVVTLDGHTGEAITRDRNTIMQWFAEHAAFLSVVDLVQIARLERTSA